MELLDPATCHRAVASRDRRFDGMFVTAVRSTGIYCRPSCPARTPLLRNVTFHRTAAAAQAAGYRACKRCLPDSAPGSPTWDIAADVAGRAMRLIADGVVERDGVTGLAGMLGYSPRHLSRLLVAELGAGPLALARAHRAQSARVLLERTHWKLADVAFAAGFRSVRQFNDTMREVYDATPTELRALRPATRSGQRPDAQAGSVVQVDLRIAVRAPFDAMALWRFFRDHAVPGLEAAGHEADGLEAAGGADVEAEVDGSTTGGWFVRSLRLPHGVGTVRLTLRPDPASEGVVQVPCTVRLSDARDVPAAAERCRRLIDADCDPRAVDEALAADPLLAPLVAAHPGLRVPGHVDGDELAVRTVLGQQVSVAAATRLARHLVGVLGDALPEPLAQSGVTSVFPSVERLASATLDPFPGPRSRADAVQTLAAALSDRSLRLDRSAPRAETVQRLMALRGIGPWTAGYVAMRALGDPDVWLGTDAAVRRRLRSAGRTDDDAATWRPWRSYAVLHLWTPPTHASTEET